MFNVIPEIFKDEIKGEYKLRLLIVIALAVICIQVCLLIFLFPTWIESSYKESSQKAELSEISQSLEAKNASSIGALIADANKKLLILNSYRGYPNVTPIISTILSKKSGPIHINEITFTAQSDGTADVILKGLADTRDSLVQFEKNLQTVSSFDSVDLPVSNFTKDKDITFSLTIHSKHI